MISSSAVLIPHAKPSNLRACRLQIISGSEHFHPRFRWIPDLKQAFASISVIEQHSLLLLSPFHPALKVPPTLCSHASQRAMTAVLWRHRGIYLRRWSLRSTLKVLVRSRLHLSVCLRIWRLRSFTDLIRAVLAWYHGTTERFKR